ncbi:MAG: FAD-dependent oxidoreductase [Candidatus Cloacimonetes bacterium]|nr:FAD-dependent oxidoreductase [Candidatus Cloacimonadota bacterium]
MKLKDFLSPFYVWKRAFDKPYTTQKPLEERPGAPRYRGFHQNDMEKCIGCGSCETICQNAAIDMMPVEGIETTFKDSGLRPRIDYGRCCWCALCVDICTTGSLKMSNEYIWIDTDPEVFRFIPGAIEKPWDNFEEGYAQHENYTLLNLDRIDMKMMTAEESKQSFLEMVKGYSKAEAMKEAQRCVECGLCVASCPAHMDIPQYISAIRDDNLDEALRLLYATNPMPATCGRICTHLCESACSIGVKGEPLAIRWLKRYIVDQIEDSKFKSILQDEFKPNGKKVAIIGSGPGGLSAAYYLITSGYAVDIYEASERAGGMIRYGVPEYRMPYDQLDQDVNYIKELGVEIKLNNRIGKDTQFKELYENYDAVFFSTGLVDPYKLAIEGEDLPGVFSGLQILDDVTKGLKPKIGMKTAIIGGGNVAMDASRTALRLGADATIIYRRREEDMPADEEEIHEAHQENVKFITQAIPIKIEKTENGKLKFFWNNSEMVQKEGASRPSPIAIEGDIDFVEVDSVISAIGQGADYSFLSEEYESQIKFKKGKVIINDHGQTTNPKIFAGGDIANPKADAISAIADGHNAALGIDKFLNKQ